MSTPRTTSRAATIIGAGQGGLHLAFGLLTRGWKVTVVSDRSPDDYLAGRALSSHTLQANAMDMERSAGIDLYDSLPDHSSHGLDLSLTMDGQNVVMNFAGDFERPAAGIDTRLKYARLLQEFERRGGRVVQHQATLDDLEDISEREPVFVATGKGGLAKLFALDEERTLHDRPQRDLMLMLVKNLRVRKPEHRNRIVYCFSPNYGEIFFGPNLHKSNTPVHTILLEARPGTAMDRLGEATDAASAVATARSIVQEFAGWEYEAVRNIELADENAWLRGAVTPSVRRPVAHLPSGRPVFGLGDVLIVMDPAAGQGANCTAWGVDHLLRALTEADADTIEEEFFSEQFERFWEDEGRHFSQFANALIQPPSEPTQVILGAAQQSRTVADAFVAAFAHPKVMTSATESIESAERFVREAQEGVHAEPEPQATHG